MNSRLRLTLPLAALTAMVTLAGPVTIARAAAPAAVTPVPAAREASATQDQPVPVPEPDAKTIRYSRSGDVLWVLSTIWDFLVPALILFTGLSARLRTWAQRRGHRWGPTFVLYVVALLTITFLIDLPLAYYARFVRPHSYGLSDQAVTKWWADALKGFGVGVMVNLSLLWIPYLLFRRSPRRWWLYSGLAFVPMVWLSVLISPIWIEPLYNKYGPMKDPALEASILDLAQRAGISGARVFEVEKSVDTKMVNAYVKGVGKTKRIVLWDTLLRKLERRETLFVMAHEMGHYVLGHVVRTLAVSSFIFILGFWVVHLAAGRIIGRFRNRLGFDRLDDIASLPLLLVLVNLTLLAVTPIMLLNNRTKEHEADRFALELTRDNHACATAMVKSQHENLTNPRPSLLFEIWRGDHPSLAERIDFCNTYRPWEQGEPLRYGEFFTARR